LATTVWVEGPLSNRLAIGTHHLAGEIAAAKGDRGTAIAELEKSVAAQDKLAYTEPPPWYFPVRQSLGATLLEAGRAKDAEAVYREDLRRHPKNGWSLFGLARALGAQKKTSEARWAEQGFATAWQRADVKLTASRF
jgi:predicted Zn-dependent protease